MVVAGAEMRVRLQPLLFGPVLFPAQQQRELGVSLEPEHAVNDLRACLLEALGPVDVGFLVEARP